MEFIVVKLEVVKQKTTVRLDGYNGSEVYLCFDRYVTDIKLGDVYTLVKKDA